MLAQANQAPAGRPLAAALSSSASAGLVVEAPALRRLISRLSSPRCGQPMLETWNPSRPSSSSPCAPSAPRSSSRSSRRSSPSARPRPRPWSSSVDDRSPAPQAQMLEVAADELDCAYVLQQDGEGPSAALNVGLAAAARARHGRVPRRARARLRARRLARPPAAPAPAPTARPPPSPAARSSSPTALIRQAGYFFSLFRRTWSARLRQRAARAARRPRRRCCARSAPSCSSIRREWIERVGLYDELLDGPHAALDYCLRVTPAGGQCVFEPTVRARALDARRRRARRRRRRRRDRLRAQARGRELPARGPRRSSDEPISRRRCSSAGAASVVSYYRCFLPAVALGADYVAWASTDDGRDRPVTAGSATRRRQLEDLFDYDVVVIQQPRGARLAAS